MAQQNKSNSLTEGSVARGMLLFAIPVLFSNLFQQLYNAADSLIVGNFLGGEALAAVGSSGSLIFLLTGFVNGVALGAGVLIARYFGAKDWESLEKAIHTTGGAGLGRRGGADGCGRDFDPADPALDGHAGGCYRQLGRLLPHLLFGFHCSGHVQCGCQHSAIGRQQPQPYEVPDYSIAH